MPELLLLWGRHVNVQKVTNTAWSYYLMKYCCKTESSGQIRVPSAANLERLGITASKDQAYIATQLYLSRPVSSIECALHTTAAATSQPPYGTRYRTRTGTY